MEETYFGCSTRTAYAAGYLAQAVAEAFDPDVDSVETALHSIRDAEMAVADAPEGYLWSEIKDDYEALAKAVASGRWDGDTRVSQDVFPSLGPDEV